MSKKELAIIALKTIVFLCTAILAVLGVSAMSSCSFVRDTSIDGRATIITTDTTYINHSSILKYPKK